MVAEALDLFIGELQTLREDLATGEELDRVFASAGEWRARLAEVRPTRERQP